MAKQNISLKVIVDKVLRHPLMAGISYEAIIDYCIDFMRIVKCPNIFEEKSIRLEVKDYRTSDLPDDFYEVIQVKCKNTCMTYSTDSFHVAIPYKKVVDSEGKEHEVVEDDYIRQTESDFTYKIQGNRIYTSFRDGEIEVAYMSIPIDEEGYPMIPDNSKFTRALEAYIKKQWFTILFDLGKLQGPILQNTQQEYAWAVGACESEFKHLTLDKAESFYKMWTNILNSAKHHRTGFATLSGNRNYTSTRNYVKPIMVAEDPKTGELKELNKIIF